MGVAIGHSGSRSGLGAPALVRLGLSLVLVWWLGGVGGAQALPSDAAEALTRAQRTAANAHLSYERHFPDQPLWREAIALGRQAAGLAPEHPAPYRFLAQTYTTVQWYSRAWNALQDYVERGGVVDAQVERQFVQVANSLGISTFDGGRRAEAVPYLETVLRYAPDDVAANDRMARWHLGRGSLEEALAFLERLATRSDEYDELLAGVRQRVQFGPTASDAYEAGTEARLAGRTAEALDLFTQATREAPAFAEAWRALADLHLQSERFEESIEAYERVVALAPDDGARAALARAREGLALAAQEEPIQPPAPAPAAPAPPPPAAPMPTPTPPAPAPPAAPTAGSLLVADARVEHRATGAGGSGAFYFINTPVLQRDLEGYAPGTLHQRLQVLTKPSGQPVRYQACLVPVDITVAPACSDAALLGFSGTGTYLASQPLTSLDGSRRIAWDEGISRVMLVVRDHSGAPIDERSLGGRDLSGSLDITQYYPMTVRYQAILVPPGASFPGWP